MYTMYNPCTCRLYTCIQCTTHVHAGCIHVYNVQPMYMQVVYMYTMYNPCTCRLYTCIQCTTHVHMYMYTQLYTTALFRCEGRLSGRGGGGGGGGEKRFSLTECEEIMTRLQDKYPTEYKVWLRVAYVYRAPLRVLGGLMGAP